MKWQQKLMGADILAAISLAATVLTKEFIAAGVITLMLITGRILEKWALGQAERELKSLIARMPAHANVIRSDGAQKTIIQIRVSDIAIGDRLLIRSGEITPTDGQLLTEATLDQSALTGEPLPEQKKIGDDISSGVLNAGSPFEYLATTTSQESTYQGIIKLVQSAQAKSAPGVRVANTWALRFLPLALGVAAITWVITGEVERAVAVLVAATPCPLILAVPIAIVAGLSQSAHNGAVIKGGGILELLAQAEVVLLDKTGTLTQGGPAVSIVSAAPEFSADEIMQLAAAVDQYSPHVVAKALVQYAKDRNLVIADCTNINEIPGHQISGNVAGSLIEVGQLEVESPEWLQSYKPLQVAVTKNGTLIGVIGLEDPLRAEAKDLISNLKKLGVKRIALVTGDRRETAQDVADSLGITELFAQVSAGEKLAIAQRHMSDSTGSVIVVGDGINDAPALAAANVGVAMGARGATAASEAADVIIVDDSIEPLVRAITIAKRARRKALQAAGLGMGLSLAIMATGALGITDATAGALLQELIDVTAILWALTTLKKIKFNSSALK